MLRSFLRWPLALAALVPLGTADAQTADRAAVHLTTLHSAVGAQAPPGQVARPLVSGDVLVWATVSPVFVGLPSPEVSVPGDAAALGGAPTELALGAPFPNPAAARVTVPYDVPTASHVRLVAYDVLGREVAVLVDAPREPGRYRVTVDGAALAAGTYVVRLASGDAAHTTRITVTR